MTGFDYNNGKKSSSKVRFCWRFMVYLCFCLNDPDIATING
jgi:hypothetical protein